MGGWGWGGGEDGGQVEGEGGALAELGGGGEGPAHGGGELAADGESESGSAVARALCAAELDVGGADAGEVFGGHAAAGVFDFEDELAGRGAWGAGGGVGGAELDVAFQGELDGVAEEVEGDLAEALGVDE